MIVVDLGCCPHDGDLSVEPLIDRFHPAVLYGFDPLLDVEREFLIGDTSVVLERKAAWLNDGAITLAVGAPSSLDATVLPEKNDRGEWQHTIRVRCFDFPNWLTELNETAVVKMNVEGAEFTLLEALAETGADARISRLIVQWHDHRLGREFTARRQNLDTRLSCPVEEWVP